MFAKITNGVAERFPYSVGDLRRDNPNTSFPKQVRGETMIEYGMVPVTQLPEPEHNPLTHEVVYGPLPVNRDGAWVLVPAVVELTPEIAAARHNSEVDRIRLMRNELLAETDWAALSDVTITPEMAAYRQALRDITSQPGFPHDVSWPTKPE
jgi:hypothetical protein